MSRLRGFTCCRLGDEHLWRLLLLLLGQQGGHTAQLGEVAAAHLQLLGLHLADVGRVGGRRGLSAQGGGCVCA